MTLFWQKRWNTQIYWPYCFYLHLNWQINQVFAFIYHFIDNATALPKCVINYTFLMGFSQPAPSILGFLYKIPRSGRLSYFFILFLTNDPISKLFYFVIYLTLTLLSCKKSLLSAWIINKKPCKNVTSNVYMLSEMCIKI